MDVDEAEGGAAGRCEWRVHLEPPVGSGDSAEACAARDESFLREVAEGLYAAAARPEVSDEATHLLRGLTRHTALLLLNAPAPLHPVAAGPPPPPPPAGTSLGATAAASPTPSLTAARPRVLVDALVATLRSGPGNVVAVASQMLTALLSDLDALAASPADSALVDAARASLLRALGHAPRVDC